MAIIYQGDAELIIGSTSIALNCNNVTIEVGQDALDATVMGNTGRKMVGGLQTVSLSATVFLEYGMASVEALIYAEVGQGDTTIVVLPSSAAPGVGNPEITISNAMISSYSPISTTVGDLSTFTLTATAGTWVRATS
jgi:hypothetical protein